ncbi:hypothetical protein Asulf_01762 [Archaeoglobus sulfaticallidus PM70-1]|uniref:Radical SAM core domain-containing protein n=1 Tax=Archaeoglobus sulfaticallidus PM70-1 TaxID=387631 RepID=N0BFD1_9EURY|nr:radical SAM/SPASM domain-containing protein [Archaeoglobus sulfaticallidus]AGK61733.1 hypothetical protein Asulf_01762 [Archaeoglobus sulfaticallidus PM70-1]
MIQIEVTSSCNLRCSYCFRKNNGRDIDLEIIEKIADSDDEFVLYGYGEPLLNKNLEKIVSRLNGKITINTNGTIDAEIPADRIGFSMDSLNRYYLQKMRGVEPEKIERNLKKADGSFIQAVITRDNLDDLSNIVRFAGENGLDVFLTNAVPPNEKIYTKVLYFEPSRKVVDLVLSLNLDEDFIIRALKDCSAGHGDCIELYRKIHDIAGREGYMVNIPYILESVDRINLALNSERRMLELEELARDFGIDLIKPKFFGDANARECPYRDSLFVRSDGKVSSCMILSRSHREFLNNHWRDVPEFIVGDLNSQDIDDVRESLASFESIRANMRNFPWCADCAHVNGCWYIAHNEDCYTNHPSCGECLYSSGIAKCLF